MSTDRGPDGIDWERIDTFIGYGRADAPVVFIGMEEGLEDADGLDQDLRNRSAYPSPVMDLKEAHDGVAGADRQFDPARVSLQRTWRVMADFMLRREGNLHPSVDDRRRYQALRLGRSDGDALLADLLPYPSPNTGLWLYERFGRYGERDAYEAEMLPPRIRLLKDVLSQAPREAIVCYGKAHWPHYERLFDGIGWREQGAFRIGEGQGACVVLTTHFSGRGFNTDEQLAALWSAVAQTKGP